MSAYNHEQYVEQAILSILNQTYQDFELIVIDDGSSDRTPEILERLSLEHGFYFERQQNMGLPKTLNKLIRMRKGKYITGCASDDYWPETRLEEQVRELDENVDVDFVHSKVTLVDEKSQILSMPSGSRTYVNGSNQFVPFIMHKLSYYAPTMMVRGSAFERVGYYNESIGVDDFEWWLRATRILNIKFIESSWVFYRYHPNNWVKRPDGALKSVQSHYAVAAKLGFFYGVLFLLTTIPGLMAWETIAGRKRRFFYILLAPLLFWKLRYWKSFVLMFLGVNLAQRVKLVFHKLSFSKADA